MEKADAGQPSDLVSYFATIQKRQIERALNVDEVGSESLVERKISRITNPITLPRGKNASAKLKNLFHQDAEVTFHIQNLKHNLTALAVLRRKYANI